MIFITRDPDKVERSKQSILNVQNEIASSAFGGLAMTMDENFEIASLVKSTHSSRRGPLGQ